MCVTDHGEYFFKNHVSQHMKLFDHASRKYSCTILQTAQHGTAHHTKPNSTQNHTTTKTPQPSTTPHHNPTLHNTTPNHNPTLHHNPTLNYNPTLNHTTPQLNTTLHSRPARGGGGKHLVIVLLSRGLGARNA